MGSESNQKMAEYALRQAAVRLDRFAYQAGRTRKSPDADSVHDLRVAIRRFQACLHAFRPYFPRKEVKKIRKRLKEVMDIAGQIRNRDIALALAAKSGLSNDGLVLTAWAKQRNQTARQLTATLKRSIKRNHSDKWRSRLNL